MNKTDSLDRNQRSRVEAALQLRLGQTYDLATEFTNVFILGSERSSASRTLAGATPNIAEYNAEEVAQSEGIASVLAVAQELGLVFPPWPLEPPEASNIIPITTAAQIWARDSLISGVAGGRSLTSTTFQTRHRLASDLSHLFGTGTPELDRMRRHLEDCTPRYSEAQEDGMTFSDEDWDLPGPPDESGTRLTVTSILSNLGRRTHHAIFVSISIF